MADKKILRVIDANFNRCKEGLRVVEDIFRFILEDDSLRKKTRKIRHSLDLVAAIPEISQAILSRDSKSDLGKNIDKLELKRTDIKALLSANLQRVKESLRVLEEFFKLTAPVSVVAIKKIRYEFYSLEKTILKKRPTLFNPRSKGNRRS